MKTPVKLLIVAALAVAVLAAVALKPKRLASEPHAGPRAAVAVPDAHVASTPPAPAPPPAAAQLPKLLDLGAEKCVPCRMMAPILEELKREYAGRLEVEFIDVWQNPEAARRHGIQMIPTQIFFDAEGRELYRHVGFFGKEDILAKWKELGVDLSRNNASAAGQ